MNNRKYILFLLIMISLMMTGCWNKQFKRRVKAIPEKIEFVKEKIAEKRSNYQDFTKSANYSKVKVYAERENWVDHLKKAEETIAGADSKYNTQMIPLLKKQKKETIPQAEALTKDIEAVMKTAGYESAYPMQRAEKILFAIDKTDELLDSNAKVTNTAETTIEEHNKLAVKAQEDYSNKQEDIQNRIKSIDMNWENLQNADKIVISESKSDNPDYALIVDKSQLMTDELNIIKKKYGDDKTKIEQLYRCYTKTLIDMKMESHPWVLLVKYAWSNYAEYDNTRQVGEKKEYLSTDEYERYADKFNQYPDGFLVKRGSDYEIWAEELDVTEKYYHKFAITENGERTETNWWEVSEETYENYEDDLGMDVVAKPYGFYEDEKLTQSTPEGMALVGNKECGRWERDRSGNRYWAWYGRYHFYGTLFGGRRYYYDDWNTWHGSYRGRKSYYGRDEGVYGTYGSAVQSDKRYQRSSFGKTKSFKSQATSVRGAGKTSRGRGPGAGGK